MKNEARERLWRIIFKADTTLGKQFDVILLIAIVLSVLAVILESIESLKAVYGRLFSIVEWTLTGIFTVEYIIRIYVVRNKWRYIFSFYGLIDFLSILPSYLGLVVIGSQSLLVIRAIRLVRIFRIFKLSRYTRAGATIMMALRNSLVKISVFLFAVLMLIIIIGTVMYLIEGKEHGFTDIPTSIYWTVVTLTTVGYGDLVPHTALGQFFAGLVMIIGYGIIAVPTGIVTASVISETQNKSKICTHCKDRIHPAEANYCKTCGEELEAAGQ